MSHKKMKILVVDDHPLVREGLREHLRQLDTEANVLEAGSSKEALTLAAEHDDLDLILLDFRLPDSNGFSALSTLRERHPGVPVVVLSAHDDRQTVLEALDKGAMGFVPKTAATAVMLNALRLVLSGGTYLPADIMRHDAAIHDPGVRTRESDLRAPAPADLGLTPRQTQILSLLVQGKPNKLISRELGLAESTVKIHITSILRALNVSSRVQAVIAVARLGVKLEAIGTKAKSATVS